MSIRKIATGFVKWLSSVVYDKSRGCSQAQFDALRRQAVSGQATFIANTPRGNNKTRRRN
jgi:hypothetical protein